MIELFTAPTPNGWKASVALEEMGLPYTESGKLLPADPKARSVTMQWLMFP